MCYSGNYLWERGKLLAELVISSISLSFYSLSSKSSIDVKERWASSLKRLAYVICLEAYSLSFKLHFSFILQISLEDTGDLKLIATHSLLYSIYSNCIVVDFFSCSTNTGNELPTTYRCLILSKVSNDFKVNSVSKDDPEGERERAVGIEHDVKFIGLEMC